MVGASSPWFLSERREVLRMIPFRHISFLQEKLQQNLSHSPSANNEHGLCCFRAMLFVFAIVNFPIVETLFWSQLDVVRWCVCSCISTRKKNGFGTNLVVDTAVPDPRKISILSCQRVALGAYDHVNEL